MKEDTAIDTSEHEFVSENKSNADRWTKIEEQENFLKDKLKLSMVIISFLALLSLIAATTVLAWAYVERRQAIDDDTQWHEPTRLYSSTSSTIANQIEENQEERSSIPFDYNEQAQLFRVYEGINTGAVCLDGTPPAYYLRPGKGLGTNRWIIHFNGGAWCFDEEACLERSRGSLGSTKHLPPAPPVIQGINSPNGQINPDFYDWNLVWVVYCDGASFTGDREDPVVVRGENIFFRGKRILDAIMEDLLKRSIQNAEGVILTGSSAGSMTAMFAVDRLAERLPNVPMHVLSDAGYFIETQPIGGKSVGAMFKRMYEMQHSANGLNKDCIKAFGNQKGWHCFLPQHTFKFIKHPVFVLNAAYDVWALLYFVGINCKFPTVTVSNAFKKNDIASQNESSLHVTNHRKTRDISGFEILPYFRKNPETTNTKETANNNLEADKNSKKSKISQPTATSNNQEKRDFETFGDADAIDSINKLTMNNDENNIDNEKIGHNFVENQPPEGPKLHLNIDKDTGVEENKVGNGSKKGEFETPLLLQSDIKNVVGNEKQNEISLNPLENSVSALSNVADSIQKDHMDTETIGLLNEVFKKLTKLLPNGKLNSTLNQTALYRPNMTKSKLKLMQPSVSQTNIDRVNFGGLKNINKGAQKTKNSTEVKTNLQAKKEKEITSKITQLLRTKQAELLQTGKLQNKQHNTVAQNKPMLSKMAQNKPGQNKPGQQKLELNKPGQNKPGKNMLGQNKPGQNKLTKETSNDIIANMFKKAGKLPNFLNSKAKQPERLQDTLQNTAPGRDITRHGIIKTKRSTNIIKEYINILRSDPPECTENQMINVMKYRNAMLRATNIVKATQSAGIFLVSCIEHSMSLFDETWTGVTIKQKSIQQAFGDWYFGRETNHFNVDGVYPSNPSCP